METLVLLLCAIVGIPALVLLAYATPTAAISVGLLAFAGPTLSMFGSPDLRPVMVPIILGLVMRKHSRKGSAAALKTRPLQLGLGMVLLVSTASFIWTNDIIKSMMTVSALGVTMALVAATSGSITRERLQDAILSSTGIIVLLSIMTGVLGVGDASVVGRLQGITSNPNALAIYALIFACAAAGHRKKSVQVACLSLAIYTSGATGSRAGTAAVLVVGALIFWGITENKLIRLVGIFALASAFIALVYVDLSFLAASSETSLFRTNNSRDEYIYRAMFDIERAWPWGTGVGGASLVSEAGVNVVLKALVELGVLAIPMLLVYVFASLAQTGLSRIPLTTFLACFANNMFEGWMLTFGNMFTVALVLLLVSQSPKRRGHFDKHWSTAAGPRGMVAEAEEGAGSRI